MGSVSMRDSLSGHASYAVFGLDVHDQCRSLSEAPAAPYRVLFGCCVSSHLFCLSLIISGYACAIVMRTSDNLEKISFFSSGFIIYKG